MTILADRASENRTALLDRLAELGELRAQANLGGGESAVALEWTLSGVGRSGGRPAA